MLIIKIGFQRDYFHQIFSDSRHYHLLFSLWGRWKNTSKEVNCNVSGCQPESRVSLVLWISEHASCFFNCINWDGKNHLLWVASFSWWDADPNKKEKVNWAQEFTADSFLTVDMTWPIALSSWRLDSCIRMTCTLELWVNMNSFFHLPLMSKSIQSHQ